MPDHLGWHSIKSNASTWVLSCCSVVPRQALLVVQAHGVVCQGYQGQSTFETDADFTCVAGRQNVKFAGFGSLHMSAQAAWYAALTSAYMLSFKIAFLLLFTPKKRFCIHSCAAHVVHWRLKLKLDLCFRQQPFLSEAYIPVHAEQVFAAP